MNRVLRVVLALALLGVFWSALMGGMLLLLPQAKIAAQAPPDETPIDPSSEPPTDEPTDDPGPEPPTDEPTDDPGPQPPPQAPSRPDPNCKSAVEGDVVNAAGQRMSGATVIIKAEGFESSMMTDDQGHYGFSAVCPGTATLTAAMAGGIVGSPTTVELDGKERLYVNLSLEPTEEAGQEEPTEEIGKEEPSPTGEATAAATSLAAQETPTGEPAMPATGFSGLWLIGGIVLTALLLVLVGARWLFAAQNQAQS